MESAITVMSRPSTHTVEHGIPFMKMRTWFYFTKLWLCCALTNLCPSVLKTNHVIDLWTEYKTCITLFIYCMFSTKCLKLFLDSLGAKYSRFLCHLAWAALLIHCWLTVFAPKMVSRFSSEPQSDRKSRMTAAYHLWLPENALIQTTQFS